MIKTSGGWSEARGINEELRADREDKGGEKKDLLKYGSRR